MLTTPLGPLKVFADNEEILFSAIEVPPDDPHLDLDGRYLIEYDYRKESGVRKISCCLPSFDQAGEIQSGERLEAISFHIGPTQLTIGMVASFGQEVEYGHDYSGRYLNNGLEYTTTPLTESQTLRFGISWTSPYTRRNEIQTWLAADPGTMKRI